MKGDVVRSLSLVVSVWIALTIAVGMAVYAVFQYAYTPHVTVAEIALAHLWHVLVLGLVIKTQEIERILRQLEARNHPLGRSIQARLSELHKALVWTFLKA